MPYAQNQGSQRSCTQHWQLFRQPDELCRRRLFARALAAVRAAEWKEYLEDRLLNGQGGPETLLRKPISGLPEWYSKMFLRLVHSAGSDRELIQSATLTLTYDLQRTRPSPIPGEPQSPYVCDVSIVDTRGRDYAARFDGWWFVERMELNRLANPAIHKWWNPFTWFRSRRA